jgi:hypothetical protein
VARQVNIGILVDKLHKSRAIGGPALLQGTAPPVGSTQIMPGPGHDPIRELIGGGPVGGRRDLMGRRDGARRQASQRAPETSGRQQVASARSRWALPGRSLGENSAGRDSPGPDAGTWPGIELGARPEGCGRGYFFPEGTGKILPPRPERLQAQPRDQGGR